jgi:hypothetical protein
MRQGSSPILDAIVDMVGDAERLREHKGDWTIVLRSAPLADAERDVLLTGDSRLVQETIVAELGARGPERPTVMVGRPEPEPEPDEPEPDE